MLAWLRGLHLPKLQPLLSAPESGALSLSEACATALPYLAVADYLQPRTVAWEQIHPAPCAKVWQRAANCAHALISAPVPALPLFLVLRPVAWSTRSCTPPPRCARPRPTQLASGRAGRSGSLHRGERHPISSGARGRRSAV